MKIHVDNPNHCTSYVRGDERGTKPSKLSARKLASLPDFILHPGEMKGKPLKKYAGSTLKTSLRSLSVREGGTREEGRLRTRNRLALKSIF